MPFTSLLFAARIIQRNYFHRGGIMEVGYWRIIEGNVSVLAKANKCKIDRSFVQELRITSNFGF
jgi:hypothetical protein